MQSCAFSGPNVPERSGDKMFTWKLFGIQRAFHRWKKLRKTGRCFPEIIKSGRKFWGNMYIFSILTANYSNIGQNPRK